jgi:hypothetical protein
MVREIKIFILDLCAVTKRINSYQTITYKEETCKVLFITISNKNKVYKKIILNIQISNILRT